MELAQGAVVIRPVREILPERPLNIMFEFEAHPAVMDMLYGAMIAKAQIMHDQRDNVPARIVVPCHMEDFSRYDYFLQAGFDDSDGDELFWAPVEENARVVYPPAGTAVIDIPLQLESDARSLLTRMNQHSCDQWTRDDFDSAARSQNFSAYAVYSGDELCGEIVTYGTGSEAIIQTLYTTSQWRRHGVAKALFGHARTNLLKRGVQTVYMKAWRRNRRAMTCLQRLGFEWLRTDRILLGRDMNRTTSNKEDDR